MNNTKNNTRLSAEQIAQYERDGYTLFHQPVFAPEKFAALQAEFERLLEKYGEANLDTIHSREPQLLEWLLADELLDLIEPVVGPNIGLFSSHFISKPAGVGKATPWHEDSAYWNGWASTMEGICTVWLALDKVDAENGAMQVIPGSHSNGFSNYRPVENQSGNIFENEIDPTSFDVTQAVTFELGAGECSLHEARIIHGAPANRSNRRRAGYTIRFFPTSTRIYSEKMGSHKLWLARGKDLAGNKFENA